MRALNRKLFRDLRRIRSQCAAIAAVVAAGVAVAVLGLCNLETLSRSRESFYERAHFADVFVSVKRAPLSVAHRISELPGVAAVEPRVVASVIIDMPEVREPVAARVVGRPVGRPPVLNDVVIQNGRDLAASPDDEVLVSRAFAAAHQLRPGSVLRAIINGRRRALTVVGVALSPEFIYAIGPGALFPDDKRFGVLWMAEHRLAAAMDLTGGFNDAVVRLERGTSAQDAIGRIEPIIEPFGGAGAFERAEQTSHWFLEGELSELRTTSRLLPLMFAGVAAFLLNIVISRLVATQREQIGLLKAFGYRSRTVAAHYVSLALIITATGIALGIPSGLWLGWAMSGLYAQFFHFPTLVFAVPYDAIAMAAAAAAAVSTVGSLIAVRAVLHLAPAEAMRPPAPARFRRTILERVGVGSSFAPWARIVIRNIERRPGRAMLSIAAVALAVGIMLLGRFTDAIEFIVETELEVAQRQSATVSFVEPRSQRAVFELAHAPGVLATEPIRTVPATFRSAWRIHRGAISGVPAKPILMRILDRQRRPLTLPEQGLILSDKLARMLEVRVGDTLSVEIREASRPVRQLTVGGTVVDYVGTAAYMERTALSRLLREPPNVSGVHLTVDPRSEATLFERLKRMPAVASVITTRAMRDSIRATIGRTMTISLTFLVLLAGVIAFGVVYNTARVALSERAWELATLRVIGFTRYEVGVILLTESALLLLIALPIGLMVGYGEAALISAAYDSEQYRIPVFFRRSSYGFSAAVVTIAAALSGAVVWRLIGRLDLIGVLKTRE